MSNVARLPCLGCGRGFVPELERQTRCQDCRERAKVYFHQLHRRRGVERYLNHDCRLCRKHRAHVREVRRRWDARGAWVILTCDQGHEELRAHRSNHCSACTLEWNRIAMQELRRV